MFVLSLKFSGSQSRVTAPQGVLSLFFPYPISGSVRFAVDPLIEIKQDAEAVGRCKPLAYHEQGLS